MAVSYVRSHFPLLAYCLSMAILYFFCYILCDHFGMVISGLFCVLYYFALCR